MRPPPPPILGELKQRPDSRPGTSPPHPLRIRLPQNWGRGGPLLLLLCAGCAPSPAVPSAAGATVTRGPKMDLTLDGLPRPVLSLDPASLTVRVTDAAGRPVAGAAVSLSLDMPDMPMGNNVAAAREMAPGVYRATGRFTMAGAWRVTASAARGASRASRAFPVEVK